MTRTALITGGAIRVGRAIAQALAQAGWDIALHYNCSEAEANTFAAELHALGRKVHLVKADLRKAEEIAAIFPALAAQHVVPDCLINNASLFEKDSLATVSAETLQAHMEVNCFGPLQLVRDFADYYKGDNGNVINLTDGMKDWSMSAHFLSYTLSKMALANATELLARELAPRIRINAIAPGPTLEGKQDKADTFAKLQKIIPLARTNALSEITDAVFFILRSESMTGQTINLAGGM